jgi:hypothetical protein
MFEAACSEFHYEHTGEYTMYKFLSILFGSAASAAACAGIDKLAFQGDGVGLAIFIGIVAGMMASYMSAECELDTPSNAEYKPGYLMAAFCGAFLLGALIGALVLIGAMVDGYTAISSGGESAGLAFLDVAAPAGMAAALGAFASVVGRFGARMTGRLLRIKLPG